MFGKGLIIFYVLLQAVFVNCLKTGVLYSNEESILSNTEASLSKLSSERPTILLYFSDFDVFDTLKLHKEDNESETSLKYLSSLFDDRVVGSKQISKPKKFWKLIEKNLKKYNEKNVKTLQFKKLPETPDAVLDNVSVDGKNIIILKFKDEVYDLGKLNDTLETVMNKLVNMLGKNINWALFTQSDNESESHIIGHAGAIIKGEEVAFYRNKNNKQIKKREEQQKEQIEEQQEEQIDEQEEEQQEEQVEEQQEEGKSGNNDETPNNEVENAKGSEEDSKSVEEDKDDDEDEDDDILSKIWTEGLLMCLLVSLLLVGVLVVAISWISSLEITYGSFEKSTNSLKKNN